VRHEELHDGGRQLFAAIEVQGAQIAQGVQRARQIGVLDRQAAHVQLLDACQARSPQHG